MTADLRVALFVEGSHSAPPARGKPPLVRIWNEHLTGNRGLRTFDLIEPISKKHLVALDPENPPMSGRGEALDVLFARKLRYHPFDVAVVAWDLLPAWNPGVELCRWQETLDLYRLMAESTCEDLDEIWKQKARQRYEELSQRERPNSRLAPPGLERGTILAVCMEPKFEALLVQDETAVRRALGVATKQVKGWPKRG